MDEPSCTNGSSHCRAACNLGSAGACVEVAYALQRDPAKEGEAYAYFQRGCLLGEPIACTNYAARIWALDHIDAQLTCARRTFERACSAREAYACGMVGRIMLENTEPPAIAPGRRHLESSCRDVGGFPCRVLAKHLESGKLGEYPPGEIGKLLAQACAGGDPDACGEPATAGETFR